MRRTRKSVDVLSAGKAGMPGRGADSVGPVVIHPEAVYTREQARQALGLKPRSLVREIAAGRLRSSRRLGRTWILGVWLLEWFRAGEVSRRKDPRQEAEA